MDEHPHNASDAAGNPERGSGSTRDVRLLARALREEWPMSPEARKAGIARLEEAVKDPATKPRAFHRAITTLMGMSRLNLSVIETAVAVRREEDLEDRLSRLEEAIDGDRGSH
jgi:hypothetical protein